MNWKKWIGRTLSYVLVAMAASVVTLLLWGRQDTKLAELERLIEQRFIGQADMEKVKDAAANAMVQALGDQWSYYISADDYAAHQENKDNAYVGIGVTIIKRSGEGFEIMEVTEGGPAEEAGVCPGDFITHVDGQDVTGDETDSLQDMIPGKVNTTVDLTLRRGQETVAVTVKRKVIHQKAVTGQLLENNIGFVAIDNFHKDAGKEIIAQVELLMEQGADKLIFDVRNNPGGYVDELNEALDYLLPEGPLFRSVDYKGKESVDESDADCLELPMAVLVNGNSYSAAEFFAAALSEYDWAVIVGEPTTGKGYFQNTIELMDGSALYLSVGKYFTPNGVSLADVGGLVPDIQAAPAESAVAVTEDPQIQVAVQVLTEQNP